MDFLLNRDAEIGSLVLAAVWILKLHLEIFHKNAPLCKFARKTIQDITQSETLK